MANKGESFARNGTPGLVEIATQAQLDAGTVYGASGAPLVVPANLNASSINAGIQSVNGDNTSAQVIAVGSAGTDVNLAESGATHTINIPTASASKTGKLAAADYQAFAVIRRYNAITAATDGATITFDLSLTNIHSVTLGGNRTLALSGETAGQCFMLRLLQDGTGSRTVTWFSGIKWAGGSAPVLTTTPDKADVFGFIVTSLGNYDGFIVGQNI